MNHLLKADLEAEDDIEHGGADVTESDDDDLDDDLDFEDEDTV